MSELCICCNEFPRRSSETGLLMQNMHIDLCDSCALAGCDGVVSCKQPRESRETLHLIIGAEEAFEAAQTLEKHWLEAQSGTTSGYREQTEHGWVQITDNYWRRENQTLVGTVISEIVQIPQARDYHSQVRITKAPRAQTAGLWLRSLDALSLSEAQSDCEAMIDELSRYITTGDTGDYGFSIMLPIEPSPPGVEDTK